MTLQMKSPASAGTGQGSNQTSHVDNSKRPLKWQRVLSALVNGRSFNRFQAEHELHDHALHSMVSNLQGKGVVIHRHDEVVPGYQGIPTHVCRYWLAPDSRDHALILLGRKAIGEGAHHDCAGGL